MRRQNPWRYNAPPGWNNIQGAPRDGTTIEIQNNYGIAPSFSICKWEHGTWMKADNPNSGVGDGPWLSWRPYSGDAASYIDPTGGKQFTANYWLLAAGMPPRPDGFAILGDGGGATIAPGSSMAMSASIDIAPLKPTKRRSLLQRLFG